MFFMTMPVPMIMAVAAATRAVSMVVSQDTNHQEIANQSQRGDARHKLPVHFLRVEQPRETLDHEATSHEPDGPDGDQGAKDTHLLKTKAVAWSGLTHHQFEREDTDNKATNVAEQMHRIRDDCQGVCHVATGDFNEHERQRHVRRCGELLRLYLVLT
jgi:hypothetical protein